MFRTYDSNDYLNGMSGGDYYYNYDVCIPDALITHCVQL